MGLGEGGSALEECGYRSGGGGGPLEEEEEGLSWPFKNFFS